jgi:hypothetical protein
VDHEPPRLLPGRNNDFEIHRPDEILEANRVKSGNVITEAELTAAPQPGKEKEGKSAHAGKQTGETEAPS